MYLEVCRAEYAGIEQQAGESSAKIAADHHHNPGSVRDLLDPVARAVSTIQCCYQRLDCHGHCQGVQDQGQSAKSLRPLLRPRRLCTRILEANDLSSRTHLCDNEGWMCWSAVDRVLCGRGSVVICQGLN